MRPLTDDERRVLTFVLSQPLRGSAALLAHLPFVSAEQHDDCGCPSLVLDVDRSRTSPAPIGQRVHFEARGRTAGGYSLEVIVRHQDGYLRELEFVAYTPLEHFRFGVPDIEQLELFGWDEDELAKFAFRGRLD